MVISTPPPGSHSRPPPTSALPAAPRDSRGRTTTAGRCLPHERLSRPPWRSRWPAAGCRSCVHPDEPCPVFRVAVDLQQVIQRRPDRVRPELSQPAHAYSAVAEDDALELHVLRRVRRALGVILLWRVRPVDAGPPHPPPRLRPAPPARLRPDPPSPPRR